MTQRKSSAGGSGKKPESDIEKEKRAKEREKAAKRRAKERERQERDAERYRKAAEAARKRAADERAKQAALENDPVYQEKKRKEAERLKERGKREMERQRKRSERRSAAAARSKAKIDERDAVESLCRALGVEPDGRDDWVADFARCLKAIARGIEAEREGDFVYTGEELLAELVLDWRCFADKGTSFEDWLGSDPSSIRPAALYRVDSMLNYTRI